MSFGTLPFEKKSLYLPACKGEVYFTKRAVSNLNPSKKDLKFFCQLSKEKHFWYRSRKLIGKKVESKLLEPLFIFTFRITFSKIGGFLSNGSST